MPAPLPSVTQILRPWLDFGPVNADVLAAAAERGTAVHRAIAGIALKLWTEPDPDIQGYVDSYLSWFPAVAEVVSVERRIVHPLGFTGQPDLVCRMDGDKGLAVVDFKTSVAPARWWRLQLAAYRELAELNLPGPMRTLAVRLKRDGAAPQVQEFTQTSRHDYSVFLNALAVWRFMNP